MMFLDDLKAYLTAHGYTDIHCDIMPSEPDECIGLFVYAHALPEISDGTCTRRVQIQVRRYAIEDAYATAYALKHLLDSGQDEAKIYLTESRWCIARPTAGPKKLTADDRCTVYYTEVSLFGEDIP